ncbi:MAG: hypothetical protein ACOH1K_00960 [Rhodoglobus sp.]
MIPWWMWVVVWVSLVLILLAVLAVSAIALFRKALTVMTELSALVEKATNLGGDAGDLGSVVGDLRGVAANLSPPQISVLVKLSSVRAQYEAHQVGRARLKRERHERRLARARRIIGRDATASRWPASWSAPRS